MKIYQKIVISMSSNEVLYEDSYEYLGEIAYLKSGGSSGGSTSGQVDYPQYMKDQHLTWLTDCATSIVSARAGNSPYYGATSHDPTTELTTMTNAVSTFNTLVDSLNHLTDWTAAVSQADTTLSNLYDPATQLTAMSTAITNLNSLVDSLDHETDWVSALAQAKMSVDGLIDDTYIDAEVAAFAAVLDDQLDTVVIPKFQRGMQDINAVQSSSFVLGSAHLYGMRDRDVAKYQSELRQKVVLQRNETIPRAAVDMLSHLMHRIEFEKSVVENTIKYNSMHITTKLTESELITKEASNMLQNHLQRVDLGRVVTHYTLDLQRMKIVANVDYNKQEIELDELDAKWDLTVFTYGSNIMASIAGATISEGTRERSQISSALGGALSGAAAGASTGGPYGAVVGAVLGGLSAYL